jgi:hypothetical protein
MEVLRVPPYPIETKWDVPLDNHAYLVYVEDVVDHSIETLQVTSDANSQITYILPRSKVQFDRDFLFRIYDTNIYGEIVVDSNLTVYRPYVDPNMLATTGTPTEVAEYKRLEIIARSIIDAYLGNDSATGEGFYNHKLIVQGIGEGTDYFPIWHNPKKILKVYENNVLVFNGEDIALEVISAEPSMPEGYTLFETSVAHDLSVGDTVTLSGFIPEEYNGNFKIDEVWSTTQFRIKKAFTNNSVDTYGTMKRFWSERFVITPNNSAIMRVEDGVYNRLEQASARLPVAVGDLAYYGRPGSKFPKGVDYVFILDVGYKAVPPDVEIATTMLIDDIKCGRNDYYNRFVTQYSTDQFDIRFSAQLLEGTGNLMVDKIISGYKGNVIKPGII